MVGMNVSDASGNKGQWGPTLATVSRVAEGVDAVIVSGWFYPAAAGAAVKGPMKKNESCDLDGDRTLALFPDSSCQTAIDSFARL
jgi:hypothetical protein